MNDRFTVMRVIGSRAVLQSGCGNNIFGSAPEQSEITLNIAGGSSELSLSARADENGRWEMTLPPFEPSAEKYTFTFSCGGETLIFTDILFGELFHISGQSNMELPMCRTYDPLAPEEFPTCEYIREFRVPIQCCFGRGEEYEDFQGGEWLTADRNNVPGMSAAGFYCALELYNKYHIPIGLLNTSVGGSAIEGRMPYRMLSELGWYDDFLKECTADSYMERTEKADRERMDERSRKVDELDGISDKIFGDDIQFEKCTVPLDLKELDGFEGFCGRIWFRKTFEIPADTELTDALLILGTITDADKAYINDKFVGETTYMYPPRIYPVPVGTAVHGTNTLLVCIDVKCGCGGFTKGKKYCIKLGDRLIDLSGEWGYAVAARVPYVRTEVYFPVLPLAMYAAMTAPAFHVKCRALLWYQGETNCGHPERYKLLFEKFVNMYRERCGEQLPVITTQLCNYDDPFAGGSDCWAELRAAQLECLSVPGTDMAVTIDVGEDNDLHPVNKKAVGERLALCVMRTVYGEKDIPPDIFCTGAEYMDEGRVLLKFSDNARVRLAENGAEAFDICFDNGNMLPALTAEMTESGLLLGFGSAEIPQKIRFEWRNAPKTIALRTAEGLPLSPFAVNIGKG